MKVFVSRNINDLAISTLKKEFDVSVWHLDSPPPYEFWLDNINSYHAILTNLTDQINSELISKATNLKVISNVAVGVNNIDLQAAKKKNILIGHTPDILTKATAELALALLLALGRKIISSSNSIRDGRWQGWDAKAHLGFDFSNKVLGIVGLGRIGAHFARICQAALGVKIIYSSPTEKTHSQYRRVEFHDLLPQSDIVSVHCPLNETTKNLFNKEAFNKMKVGSIFINVARGQIHDENALILALKNNHLWGAALDVTNPEPMHKDNELLYLKNAIITPHIGSATAETREQMAMQAAHNIIYALKEQKHLGRYIE